MAVEEAWRKVAELYSNDLEKISRARFKVLKILFDVSTKDKKLVRAKDLEKEYTGSPASLYSHLKELIKQGLVENVKEGVKDSFYRLTDKGLTITAYLLEKERLLVQQTEEKPPEVIRKSVKVVELTEGDEELTEAFEKALTRACISLALSTLDNRQNISKIDFEAVKDRIESLLKSIAINKNLRKRLLLNMGEIIQLRSRTSKEYRKLNEIILAKGLETDIIKISYSVRHGLLRLLLLSLEKLSIVIHHMVHVFGFFFAASMVLFLYMIIKVFPPNLVDIVFLAFFLAILVMATIRLFHRH